MPQEAQQDPGEPHRGRHRPPHDGVLPFPVPAARLEPATAVQRERGKALPYCANKILV